VRKIGWPSTSADFGFGPKDSTVMISRHTGGNHISSVSGSTAAELMPYVCDALVKQYSWQIMFSVGQGMDTLRPQILLSPIIAETIAASGWSKADLRRHLFEHARIPAHQFERILRDWTQKPIWNLAEEHRAGRIPKVFHESVEMFEIVAVVGVAHDDVASARLLYASVQRSTVAARSNVHDPGTMPARDLLRSISRTVVGDQHLSLKACAFDEPTGFAYADGDCLRLVEAGHQDGQFER
jgi:hypothetical protein